MTKYKAILRDMLCISLKQMQVIPIVHEWHQKADPRLPSQIPQYRKFIYQKVIQQYRRSSAGTYDTNSYQVNIGPALVATVQGYLQLAGDVGT